MSQTLYSDDPTPGDEVGTQSGHWQPAMRPDDYPPAIPTSEQIDEGALPDFSQWQTDDPSISETSSWMPPRALQPILPEHNVPGIDKHQNDKATVPEESSPSGEERAGGEASRLVNDRDIDGENSRRFEHKSDPAGTHNSSRGDGTNTNYKDLKPSDIQVARPPAEFGLSLPDRGKASTKHDGSELSSDEDTERLDPAWGIKRMDSSQVLAQVQRSPSFPDFVSQHQQPVAERPIHLPVTEAEGILEEVENITGDYEPFNRRRNADSANPPKTVEHEEGLNTAVYNPEASAAYELVNGDTNAETRFEEGVPLMHEGENPEGSNSASGRITLDDLFGASDHTDESEFFNRPVDGSTKALPPSLDRKGTVDVLQSLHYASGDSSDSPAGEGTQTPVEASKGDDVGATNGAFKDGFKDDQDDEISAMWKAALEDDEFLVEDPDELLPDSAPDSPSSFLASLEAEDVSIDSADNNSRQPDSQSLNREPAVNSPDTRSNYTPYQRPNPVFTPHQPSTSDLTQLAPTSFGSMGNPRLGISSINSVQQQFQRPALAPKTESFVDQSKGGYKSPYDLPLELAKPRKRTPLHPPTAPSQAMPPPPRSSSMTSERQPVSLPSQLQSPFSPIDTSFPGLGRSSSSQVAPPSSTRNTSTAAPQTPARPASTTFFEELPITARPRPPTGQGRYTPQQPGATAPPPLLAQSPPPTSDALPPRPSAPPHPPSDPYAQYQLRRPERLDPYANVPLQPSGTRPSGTHAAISSRYSPALPASQAGVRPSPSPRYSPAPPPQPSNAPTVSRYVSQPASTVQTPPSRSPSTSRYVSQPSSNAPPVTGSHPFQPRTSSPLAHFGRSVEQQQQRETAASSAQHYADSIQAPPKNQSQSQASAVSQPMDDTPLTNADFAPPRRSQTQSPGKRDQVSRLSLTAREDLQRPASVHGQASPVKAASPYDFVPPPRASVRQRGLSQHLHFIQPTDGQEHDELQRWKGSPIFRFGFGGSAVSSFPKHIPRYSAGSALPMYKPTSGEVHINSVKEVTPLSDHAAKFPGPLRSKSKKKEVLSWLSDKITGLEQTEIQYDSQAQLPDLRKRQDEKVLLWKIVKIIVEHDGNLEGSAEVRKAINLVLSPEFHVLDDAPATQYAAGNKLAGIYRPAGSAVRSEPVNPVAVETLRKSLLRGDRDKAVWAAVDNRLWAHALLISSTLEKSLWKQVVQEFVKQEVKTIGANTESLAALYQIFAGNLDDSIDELVPPSARAGLQMVSKIDSAGPTKNALDGLDRWRETLSLVLNNRSENDHQALAALGGLLASYGRVEAAHLCYLFSRSSMRPNIFAGADDPNATIVLLGVDHRAHPFNFFRDEDAILLTEVYEFATSVLPNTSTLAAMPHLQAYKLQRAIVLAEVGYNVESQAYCDAIAALSRSTTKMSSYHSPQFHAELDELSRRLKQAPVESSSWIAKPSIEKVSGTVWNKFTSFVAGDDSDAESKGSGKDPTYESGPFANVTGTPSLSRSGSTTDLYGAYPGSAPQSISATMAGSRYAPGAQHANRSSSELLRARSSLDSQRSPPSVSSHPMQSQPLQDQGSPYGSQNYLPQSAAPYQSLGQSPPSSRYQNTPPQTSYMPNSALENSPQSSYRPQQSESYVPTPPPEESVHSSIQYQPESELSRGGVPAFGGHTSSPQAKLQRPSSSSNDAETTHDRTQSYGYEPPAETGYVPYEPDADSDTEEVIKRSEAPKKKSFLGDDDDDFPRVPAAAAVTSSTATPHHPSADAAAKKRANDLAADAAFRAAAEADAQRANNKNKDDKSVKPKASGWFGGWLGGKNQGSLDDTNSKAGEQKVIRAKLGEESSFYYDQNLKKWINKKNPDAMQAGARATPPPPKGSAGRVLTPSASLPAIPTAVGSAPPNRTLTPDENSGIGPPMVNGSPKIPSGVPPAAPGPPSGRSTPPIGTGVAPPSRPSTGLSNASSIDDLLGPANASGRKTVRGKKGAKGRYVDLLASKPQGESS